MWNGIEDIYVNRTGEEVPEAFLFALCSFGESVFLKFNDKKRAFMFSVADWRAGTS